MSYLVLARKYRPQSFHSVVGQEHITRALANALLRDTVAHALLFAGPRGVGKTTTARLLARALNCSGREFPSQDDIKDSEDAASLIEPCGECQNCIEIARGSSLAVWEIDGASNNSVDNVRELIDSLRTAPPPHTKYKIYLIDEVHMLSTSAFNALLKSLEEPPPNTIFIFATTEPHKIPETVLSRCQRYDFRALSISGIVSQLSEIVKKEKLNVDDRVLDFIARKSQGGMRDSQSMLDRLISYAGDQLTIERAQEVFGAVGVDFFEQLARAILNQDPAKCFELIDHVFSRSIDNKLLLDDFLTFWRNLLLVACLQKESKGDLVRRAELLLGVDEASRDILVELANEVSVFDATRFFKMAEELVRRALGGNYPRYVFEAGVAEMATMPSLKPLAEILSILQGESNEGPKKKEHIKPSAVLSSADQATAPAKKESPQIEEAALLSAEPSATVSQQFNPSWQEFITFLKERSEFVLAAFLRRVSAKRFASGVVELEGLSFDLNSLQESKSLASLRQLLCDYSGVKEWSIKFNEVAKTEQQSTSTNSENFAPDSLAAYEGREQRDRTRRVIEEAKNQDAVRQALDIFEGSIIERIGILEGGK